MNREKLIQAGRMILEAIGENPDREGLKKTPERMAKMYEEVFSGLDQDPHDIVGVLFNERYDQVVLVKDICFTSMCEHHLLPFVGKAHCAYLPNGRVLGISKLARVVDLYSKRPQVQERLTNQIAELVDEMAQPRGVAVVLEASHTCMTIRGVRKPGSHVITSAVRGIFRENAASRAEVMTLINDSRRSE